jgi:hypothetical protein
VSRKKPKKSKKRKAAVVNKPASTQVAEIAQTPTPTRRFGGSSQVKRCPHCPEGSHEGDPAFEKTLAELDSDAMVFFDRDIGETGIAVDLCGPRFRLTNGHLFAHFGSPRRLYDRQGSHYVVFCFDPAVKCWKLVTDTRVAEQARSEP